MSRLSLLVLGVFSVIDVRVCTGDEVVKVCSVDRVAASGPMDLRRALAVPGRVTFICPAGSVIRIIATHDIAGSVTIDGGGAITLDAGGALPMFTVRAGATLTLKGLTLVRGRAEVIAPLKPNLSSGGIVSGPGSVVIQNSTIRDTSTAVWMTGSAQISDSEFADGAGTVISAPTLEVVRTKIHGTSISAFSSVGGTASITDTEISGGGVSYFDKCKLRILNSKFTGSASTAVMSGCDTTISGGEFTNNHGQNGGALLVTKNASALRVRGVHFTGNTADFDGGAIALEAADSSSRVFQLANVSFIGNRGRTGGALSLGGTAIQNNLKVEGEALIFQNNQASSFGGAIGGGNAKVTLTRVLFLGNSAATAGGAIALLNQARRSSTIANAIFTGNRAPRGSAINGAEMTVINATIVNNADGPAISPFWPAPESWRVMKFRNVAFVANTGGACDQIAGAAVGNNPVYEDDGNNLQFPASGCPASIPVGDPKLDAMFIPALDGAANGKGDVATCLSYPVDGVDFFGRTRGQARSCSIGAVEADIADVVINRHKDYPDAVRAASSGPPPTPPAGPPPSRAPTLQSVAPLKEPPALSSTPSSTTEPTTGQGTTTGGSPVVTPPPPPKPPGTH